MGGLPRKQPPRAVGHRRRFAEVVCWHKTGSFEAYGWENDGAMSRRRMDAMPFSTTAKTWMVMSRSDFERLENQGRAVDACAPAPGVMPGRG